MAEQKPRVAVLFGGQSAEHDVSLMSARNIAGALGAAGYAVTLIAIDRDGRWYLAEEIAEPRSGWPLVTLAPGGGGALYALGRPGAPVATLDLVFPALHGPFGEDGSLQGLLKLAGVACVGSGILASSVGMDKDVAKRLLAASGIPVVKTLTFTQADAPDFAIAQKELGLPLFVKPANLGSSVGVSKVYDQQGYDAALRAAFSFDHKVLAEANAEGQEIECAVLERNGLEASLPGEIVPVGNEGFYSYDAKYIDEDGAKLHAPAALSASVVRQVQDLSIKVARVLGCNGMVRVDYFLKANGELLVNEINTLPGFTAISMYPKLWEVSGIKPADLVSHLVDEALARFARDKALKTGRA